MVCNALSSPLKETLKMQMHRMPSGEETIKFNNRLYSKKYCSSLDMGKIREYFIPFLIKQFNAKKYISMINHDIYSCQFLQEEGLFFVEVNKAMEGIYIYYLEEVSQLIEPIIKRANEYKEAIIKSPTISLIYKEYNEFCTKKVKIPFIHEKELLRNYTKDFPHKTILNHFSKDKGIVLFYGKPGTGKTTYIKALASFLLEKKNLVYLPANLVDSLTNPEMLGIFADIENSILVIEDAEKAITKRDKDNNSIVTTILNLSDGILAEMFKIQVLATFNTSIDNIDDAILRKGRLLGKYEFTDLPKEQVYELSNGKLNKAAPLCEIYG